jgi:hypothetical protein
VSGAYVGRELRAHPDRAFGTVLNGQWPRNGLRVVELTSKELNSQFFETTTIASPAAVSRMGHGNKLHLTLSS